MRGLNFFNDWVFCCDQRWPDFGMFGGRKKIFLKYISRTPLSLRGVTNFCEIYYVKTKAFTDFKYF
jgi:hypothetical protein